MPSQYFEPLPQLRIGGSDPRLVAALSQVYGPLRDGEPTEVLGIQDGALSWNGVVLMPLQGADLPPLLESLINHRVGLEPDFLVLHAGHVHWRGQDWLISGDRGSGKSTLASLLVGQGAAYGSDELTALSLADGSLRSIYKAVTIKAEHSPLAESEGPGWQDPFRGRLQYPHPEYRAQEPVQDPMIVFPVFDPEAEPSLHRLDAGLAFLALGQQAFGGLLRDVRRCERLADLAENGNIFRLGYRCSEEAMEQLERIQEAVDSIPLARDVERTPLAPTRSVSASGRFPDQDLCSVWMASRRALGNGEKAPVSPGGMERWLDLVEGHRLNGLLSGDGSLLHAAAPAQLRAEARRAIGDVVHLEVVLRDLSPEVILLKGASYLGAVYPYAAQRDWADVDVLFLDGEKAKAEYERLRGLGYQPASDLDAHHHLPALRHPLLPVSVELHTDVAIPALGPDVIAWFAERTEERGGLRVLRSGALAVLTAVHAVNDPVDSPLLRQLIEFSVLDVPGVQIPAHDGVQEAVRRCRQMVAVMEGAAFDAEDAMDRAMVFALQVPEPLRRTPFLRWRAAVHRRRVECWHQGRQEGRVADGWRVLGKDRTSGGSRSQQWTRDLGGHRVSVHLGTGEMKFETV